MRILALALAATAVAAATLPAEAQRRPDRGYRYITVESRYGPQTVTGPVRIGPHGRLEVGLPGGTWLECGRSCRETLRRETVDFWQEKGRPGSTGTDGPGYLRFRF